MEKTIKDKDMSYCSCANCQPGMSGWHSPHRFYLLRWLLGLLIIMIAFGLGVKIGEFKGMFDSGRGYDYQYGPHYMQPYQMYVTPQATTGTSTTTSKTTTTK